MSGGVSAYAAVSARVRVKYSYLLSAAEMRMLGEAADVRSLVDALKRTAYGPQLDTLKEPEPDVATVVEVLRTRLVEEAQSVIRSVPGLARPLLSQFQRRHEVGNLKAVLRALATGEGSESKPASWERIRPLLYPLGGATQVPAERMLEAGSVAAGIELLRGGAYYEPLAFALKRYSAEQSLFPLEVALDLSYWRKLWQEARKLAGEDQVQALRVVGSLVDTNNLMWVIRYRVYKHLSEEELINYTLPFGHQVADTDIRAIAAGGDIGSILQGLFPGLRDVSELLQESHSGLPLLEVELKRCVAKRCLAAFLGNPFHIGLPLAYMILHDLEVQDLIVLLEAKSAHLGAQRFQPYLLAGAGVAA
jgi:V/A-type H+-transporting ATPase subunit C